MPVRVAASISITSIGRSSLSERQDGHSPQGSGVGPPWPSIPVQFRPLAMIRAVVVLPMPRMPASRKACAIRPTRSRWSGPDQGLLADQPREALGR
jgi:hypothetical protein